MGELAASSDALFLSVPGAYWRRDRGEISASYPRRSAGFQSCWLVGRRTRGRRLMAQQKSEDRVLLEGGVMPAERAGSSPGGQGKAIPVDQTAGQLCLPIATAEDPRGSARVVASNLSGTGQAGVPEAIGNAEQVTSVTMEGGCEPFDGGAVRRWCRTRERPALMGRRSASCASSGRSRVRGWPLLCWMGAIDLARVAG